MPAKIAVARDSEYAPCCFLICLARVVDVVEGEEVYDWDTREEEATILLQTDWDFPSAASTFGWTGADSDIAGAAAFLDECCESGRVIDDPGYFASRAA